MKSLRSKESLDKAKRWFALKKKLAELNEELAEIKEYFDCEVKEGEAVLCGKFVIGSTQCTRSGLDKDLILKEEGQEFIEQYTKTTWYTKLDIKRAAAGDVIVSKVDHKEKTITFSAVPKRKAKK